MFVAKRIQNEFFERDVSSVETVHGAVGTTRCRRIYKKGWFWVDLAGVWKASERSLAGTPRSRAGINASSGPADAAALGWSRCPPGDAAVRSARSASPSRRGSRCPRSQQLGRSPAAALRVHSAVSFLSVPPRTRLPLDCPPGPSIGCDYAVMLARTALAEGLWPPADGLAITVDRSTSSFGAA